MINVLCGDVILQNPIQYMVGRTQKATTIENLKAFYPS